MFTQGAVLFLAQGGADLEDEVAGGKLPQPLQLQQDVGGHPSAAGAQFQHLALAGGELQGLQGALYGVG